VLEELTNRQSDVADDLTEENGRDVASLMERHGGSPAIDVLVSPVAPRPAYLLESEPLQHGGDFGRLKDWEVAHG
jgi:hypothetical protein